ncbi:MAG TPA: chemotaxis protein CheA [Anaerolineaceae bacterium]|nr:chemotaxis protein CheA [Anaerolineaceae bacterium]
MDLIFDISQDELPIFIAETDDHLQILDEGLVELERANHDADLIQRLFRAAHTLKGSAGMIGHKRLVEVTHVLESAFDGIRKDTLPITTPLVDLCLEAVDSLRTLRDEVTNRETSPVEVKEIVNRFQLFLQTSMKSGPVSPSPAQKENVLLEVNLPVNAQADGNSSFSISADISKNSIATAARAFQLMLALQELGEIVLMDPSQEIIETAAPVQHFTAELKTQKEVSEIRKSLGSISEIENLQVEPVAGSPCVAPSDSYRQTGDQETSPAEEDNPKLGEFLVAHGLITRDQLNHVLSLQSNQPGQKSLIGQILVSEKILTQDALQNAIAELIHQQRLEMQAAKSPSEKTKDRSSDKAVRTSVERLDALMNLVGELITDRNRLNKVRSSLELELRGNETISTLTDAVIHLSRITDQLQEEVMVIRMVPVANVFNKFPRMVRDLAQKSAKEVQLVIQGQETELDRSVIDELNDPLIHLIRNAIDHGIEIPADRISKGKTPAGTLKLTAHHEQGRIVITVEDDGKGINTDKLKASAIQKGLITEAEARAMIDEDAIDLIFMSGLSTAEKVSDISGRGVGMDIVRNNIERINGSVVVQSTPGVGTRFQIVLPLTLAIVPTLLVKVRQTTFAIPLTAVIETLRVEQNEIQTINGRPVIILRGQVLPLVRLTDALKMKNSEKQASTSYVVVMKSIKTQLGLLVDSLVGKEEVVVKSLSSMFSEVVGISGAAILGDGVIALIIDAMGLFKSCGTH